MANFTNNSGLGYGEDYLNGTILDTMGYKKNSNYNPGEILKFQFYMYGIMGNIVAVLGLVGNISSMVVLLDRRMRSSTSVYLFSLAVCDSVLLVAMTLVFSLPVIHSYTYTLDSYMAFFPYMQPVAYPICLIAQTCTIYITVSFTVERYIAVCRPLRAADMCTVPRARRVVLATFVFAVIYNIPRMLEYKVVYKTTAYNTTVPSNDFTSFGRNKTFRHIYFIYMQIPIMVLLPFIILAVFNTFLIRAVRNSERIHGRVNHRARRENNLTIMLISVVIIFLITQVASIADNFNSAMKPVDQQIDDSDAKLTTVSTFMVILNSATNFYLYCVFGRKFRRVFCHIFCRNCSSVTENLGSKENNNSSLVEGSFKGVKLNRQRTETFRLTSCKSYNGHHGNHKDHHAHGNGYVNIAQKPVKYCSKPLDKREKEKAYV